MKKGDTLPSTCRDPCEAGRGGNSWFSLEESARYSPGCQQGAPEGQPGGYRYNQASMAKDREASLTSALWASVSPSLQ